MDPIHQAAEGLLEFADEQQPIAAARGLAVGAIFSLKAAQHLPESPLPPEELAEFSAELDAVLRSIGAGDIPDSGRWLAGFHMNSAVLRLAFSVERTLKIIDPPVPPNDDPQVLRKCRKR